MDINLEAFRIRIGNFSTAGHFSYTSRNIGDKNCKSNSSSTTFRRLSLYLVLLVTLLSRTEIVSKIESEPSPMNYVGNIATTLGPVSFFILGGQKSLPSTQHAHLYHDHAPVHLEVGGTLLQGKGVGDQDIGWIVSALPLQVSILSDSNFFARYTYGNRTNRGMKLTHWNAGNAHLENKMNNIESLIVDHHPHILGISEANLFKNHCIANCRLEDYELITCNTMNNHSLGVSRVVVYKHTSVVAKVREDLMSDEFSSIWLEVGFPGKTRFLVCNLYRDWQYLGQASHSSLDISEQLARWVTFLEQWERALESGKECIVMGDFNLDFLTFYRNNFSSNSQARLRPLVEELFARVVPHGVKQCVLGPTRQGWAGQTDSGLDHLWTNNPEKMSQIYTKYFGSDHKVIMGVRFTRMIRNSTRYVKKRSYKHFDEEKFLNAVKSISWWGLYQETDVSRAAELFTCKIRSILDVMAPVKIFQTNTKYCPWLTDETKVKIEKRNKAQQDFSENKTEDNLNKYRSLRNKVTKSLKKDKYKWQKSKLNQCGSDPSKLWKNVLGWLNWSSSASPTKLYKDGQLVTSPARLADIMNNFFIDKISKIRQNLPASTGNPLATLENMMRNRNAAFSLTCVHPETVRKIILGLKNSKASGMDDIDTYIIKLLVDVTLPAITHLVNLSIQQASFPELYKKSKVIPLFKKDDPLLPKNYRPVAILCIVSKVIERAVFLQIVEYMSSNDLFHPNHHGFRADHSTTTAMIQMYDNWVQAVDRGELVGVCMLDMSAAFDVVDHDLLIKKLKLYGFDENSLKWMRNYLSGRSQAVYIDGFLSSFLPVDVGVPQGSILGPLCYVIFTNDLPETILASSHVHWGDMTTYCDECGGLCCFADDSTYGVSSKDPEVLERKLNDKYSILANYMGNNRLKLNDDKTHLLIMTTKQKQRMMNINIQIKTATGNIEPKSSEKLLGIWIKNDLKWAEYLQNSENSLIKQLNTRLNALRMIGQVVSFRARLMVANGIFCSKLIFQMSLWGGAEECLLSSIQKVQNKAARYVTRRGIYSSSVEILRQCGWLSVRQLVFFHSATLIYKSIITCYPKYIHSKLTLEFPYNTRLAQSDCVRLGPAFKSRLELTERSFMNRATVCFNKLPPDLRKVEKLENFKVRLKKWVLENIKF